MFLWYFILIFYFVPKSFGLDTYIIVHDDQCDDPCFRRLLSGKRITHSYVRRAMECDRLDDCHRMCEYERGFTCEGFNYRLGAERKKICELTSTPINRIDLHRDFVQDNYCDFYERDWSPRKCTRRKERPGGGGVSHPSNWWSRPPSWTPAQRPRDPYDSSLYPRDPPKHSPPPPSPLNHPPYGGSFDEETKLTLELPRPINPHRKYPLDDPRPVRPIESYYPHDLPPRFPDRNRPDYPYGNRIPQYDGKRPTYEGNGYSYGRPPAHDSWFALKPQYIPSNHRRVGYPRPESNEVIPYDPHRRKPDNGWGDYGPSYAHDYPYHPPPGGPKYPHKSLECSVKATKGCKFTRPIIAKSYCTSNLEQCEKLCQNQQDFICLTFAYRSNVDASSPADNCHLSDKIFEDLIFYTDLEPDRDYDIYAMMSARWCEDNKGPTDSRPTSIGRPIPAPAPPAPVPPPPPRTPPPEECFWRVRSGFCMPPTIIRKSCRVESLGECQVQCVASRDFFCRSFVYKYESHPSGLSNCFLSNQPAVEMDYQTMQDMDGAELYERGLERSCDPHHSLPPHPPEPVHGPPPNDASCYASYNKPCKLLPYAITETTRVESESQCRHRCSIMRHQHSPPCMSFNYNDNVRGDNCYLSDISIRDLRPGLDYTPHDDYILHYWNELESRCVEMDFGRQHYFLPLDHPHGNFNLDQHFDDQHHGKPFDNPYYYEITIPEPNKPAIGHSPFDGLSQGGYDDGDYDNRYHYSTISGYPGGLSVFQSFTVNGHPCKRGRKCTRNQLVGFWSCEPEGAEPGSWDYCCEPTHHCGYSQGYNYPWCYVGPSEDQWRPCSETYYPYQLNPRPLRPQLDDEPSYSRSDDDQSNGRHWPITFLHRESPPNGTDSVANDSDDQDSNSSPLNSTTDNLSGRNNDADDANDDKDDVNHSKKRGIPATMIKKDNQIHFVPLRIITRFNGTNRYTDDQLFTVNPTNPSLKFINDKENNIKSKANGQFYFIQKLNTSLTADQHQSKRIGRIERVTKSDHQTSSSSSTKLI